MPSSRRATTGRSAATLCLWIDQNPSQLAAGYSFGFDDASGVVGAFPSGRTSHYGPVSSNSIVTVGSAPVVAVRKPNAADVDFLGVSIGGSFAIEKAILRHG